MIDEARRTIFSAVNFHCPACGVPPELHDDVTSAAYHGYFVNRHGEQWLLTIDPKTRTGVLRGGDVGWEEEIRLGEDNMTGDTILGEDERRWLEACWMAACGDSLTSS